MRETPWMVLVGPACAGKTTLGQRIAAITGRPFVDLDNVSLKYYEEAGWPRERWDAQVAAVGFNNFEKAMEPARAHAVRRVVADHPGAIIALGANHTVYFDKDHLKTVQDALQKCSQVVRVLPSPERPVALSVLRERAVTTRNRDWIRDGFDYLTHWVDDPGTAQVATHTVYNLDETPDQTAGRLLQHLSSSGMDARTRSELAPGAYGRSDAGRDGGRPGSGSAAEQQARAAAAVAGSTPVDLRKVPRPAPETSQRPAHIERKTRTPRHDTGRGRST
ncbi:hypothetical protein AB0F43_24820 [Kribbella sp. NPDC023972]|uniref:hypothetical protein n=1 Tax=Kribbella sp. NPDC023972 TaxID=3154795 RepID=UPI0033C71530